MNLNSSAEKLKSVFFNSSDSIQNPKMMPKHFSFISQEKSESHLKDSLVYTESQKQLGSFINVGTNLA
jgi:hypothetical protein